MRAALIVVVGICGPTLAALAWHEWSERRKQGKLEAVADAINFEGIDDSGVRAALIEAIAGYEGDLRDVVGFHVITHPCGVRHVHLTSVRDASDEAEAILEGRA